MKPEDNQTNNNPDPKDGSNFTSSINAPQSDPLYTQPEVGVNEAKALVEDEGVLNVVHAEQLIDQQTSLNQPVQQDPQPTQQVQPTETQQLTTTPINDASSTITSLNDSPVTTSPNLVVQNSLDVQAPASQVVVGNIETNSNSNEVGMPASLPTPQHSSFKLKISQLFKKSPKQIAILSALMLFAIGGLAFAWLNYGPGMADRAVASSMAKLVDDNYFEAVKANISIKDKDQTYSLYTIAGKQGNIYRSDFSFKYSLFNIEGSGIYDMNDKSTYLKINGLKEFAASFGLPLGQDVGNKWIKIPSSASATPGTGPSSNTSTDPSLKCIEGLYSLAKTSEFKQELLSIYKNNQFAQIKREGSEKVDGQKATKYAVAINSQKMNSFGQSLLTSQKINDRLKQIDKSCTLSDSSSNGSSTNQDDELKFANVNLWLNSKKQLVQMTAELSSGSTASTLQLNMLDKSNLDYSIPTDTANGLESLFGEYAPVVQSIQI